MPLFILRNTVIIWNKLPHFVHVHTTTQQNHSIPGSILQLNILSKEYQQEHWRYKAYTRKEISSSCGLQIFPPTERFHKEKKEEKEEKEKNEL